MNAHLDRLPQLVDAAGALAAELRQLRERFEALCVAHGSDWARRELEGYPAGAVVPRYRQVACAIRGELASPAGTTEVAALPVAHLDGGDRAVIRAGLAAGLDLAGRDGFRLDAGAFVRDIDPQQYALFLRGMPPERRGWRLLEAWECVPLASLRQMLDDIGAYGRAMHEDAVRRGAAGNAAGRS